MHHGELPQIISFNIILDTNKKILPSGGLCSLKVAINN